MNIKSFGRTSSPLNMSVSGIKKAPVFSLKVKKFGYECGFFADGSNVEVSELMRKGHNLFAQDAAKEAVMLVVTANMIESYFGTNESAYNRGKSLGEDSKYVVCDFENEYGNYDNPTNLDRLGHFLKGVKDAGSYAGEFLYSVWNDVRVWDEDAKSQLINPEIRGIGDKTVPSLGVKLSSLYNFYKTIGYGSNYVSTGKNHDPRTAIYNYVYGLKVHAQLQKKGLVSSDCVAIGFLWGGCDSYSGGKPTIKHRIYLDDPYNGYISINHHNEESLSVMKGFGTWAFTLGNGAYYWNSRIRSSDTKNDVIDIMNSGYPFWSYEGTSTLPGSRPNPIRAYPYLDGLSKDVLYEAAYETFQIEDILNAGEIIDADFSFKRGSEATFTDVVKPIDGTGIVDDFTLKRPIVSKIVEGKNVVFVVQDPTANQGTVTKLKLKHSTKTWFVTVNADEPKVFIFNL